MPTKAKAKSSQLTRGFEPYKETKGEEYMGEPMRAHFTGILNKWKLELMQEVDRTVHHMQDDSCGVEIGIRRLEARPTAALCIDCKTLAEIKEKQIGS